MLIDNMRAVHECERCVATHSEIRTITNCIDRIKRRFRNDELVDEDFRLLIEDCERNIRVLEEENKKVLDIARGAISVYEGNPMTEWRDPCEE